MERGNAYPVPVGYQKGGEEARQNLVFNVQNTPGTASEFTKQIAQKYSLFYLVFNLLGMGLGFDYYVRTATVRALFSATQPTNVDIVLRIDAIARAQEPNETFTLTLNPVSAPTPRAGLFFKDTIQVTIVDSDSKNNYSCMHTYYEILINFVRHNNYWSQILVSLHIIS